MHPLRPEDAVLVDEHTSPTSIGNFPDELNGRTIYQITNMPSCGFYTVPEGRLVSWTTVSLEGLGSQAYTIPEYRGNMLFNMGASYLARQLEKKGRDPYTFVRESNKVAMCASSAQGDILRHAGDPVVNLRYEPKT